MSRLLCVLTGASYALTASACASELPRGWEEAAEIPVEISECDSTIEVATSRIDTTVEVDEVHVVYSGASFRCSQEVCAFHKEENGVGKVLAQPCDLNPKEAAKCDCSFNLKFTLPLPTDEKIEIWRGTDNHGSPAEQEIIFEGEL